MEVIECDRCKGRVGEKSPGTAEQLVNVKVKKGKGRAEEKVLCVACGAKLDDFMRGNDDLRTVRPAAEGGAE